MGKSRLMDSAESGGSTRGLMLATRLHVESIEALYVSGEKVAAILECRAIALQALPGHAARLQAYCERHGGPSIWSLPRDADKIETFVYGSTASFENQDASAAVGWCAKWLVGREDTRTDGRGNERRTVTLRGRDDFAHNAFIALRHLVDQGATQSAAQSAPVRLVQDAGAEGPAARERRDPLRALIDRAVNDCGGMEHATNREVWVKLEAMAASKNRPFLGQTEEGLQWQDKEGNPRYLSVALLAGRLRRARAKAR